MSWFEFEPLPCRNGSVGQQGHRDLQGQGGQCGRLDAVTPGTQMAFGLFPDPKPDLTQKEKCLGQITVINK